MNIRLHENSEKQQKTASVSLFFEGAEPRQPSISAKVGGRSL